jgi:hypothetical protein
VTGQPDTSRVRTVPDTWMREVDKALSSLKNTTSQMLTLVTEAEARWRSSADRFEALVREILAAEQRVPSADLSPCRCQIARRDGAG